MRKALGLIAAFAASAAFADFTAWTHKATITLNTSAGGANVAGDVTNYPTLIRLLPSHTEFWAVAKANGDDVRFTLMDNLTELPHEIEYWSDAGDSAVIWVLVPSITGNSSANQIRLHVGNPAADNTSDGAAVFAPANGWVGVWHMTGGTTAGNTTPDATGNGQTGTLETSGTAQNQSIVDTTLIGVAKAFRATNTGNNNGGFAYLIDGTPNNGALPINNLNTNYGPFTISAWVLWKECAGGSRMSVISKYSNNNGGLGDRGWAIQTGPSGNPRLSNNPLVLATGSTTNVNSDYSANHTTGSCATLQYLSGTYNRDVGLPPAVSDPTGMTAWLNDGTVASTTETGPAQGNSVGVNAAVYIGRLAVNSGNNGRYFRGAMDEIRVSTVAHSDDWKLLDFKSQHPNTANLVSIGAAVPVKNLPANGTGFISARAAAGLVTFTFPSNAVGTLSVIDVHGRTVYSREVTAGTQEISWTSVSGKGVYFARFASKNANIRLADAKFTVIK